MLIIDTPLEGLLLLEPKVFRDTRGFFVETWQKERYQEAGINFEFVQDNRTFSRQGTLRGMHFQKKHPQGKLVSVVEGKVFDAVIDLRKGSKTFGRWFGSFLDSISCRQLWIPPGFAHGFYVLSETAYFEYKCTDFYYPGDEGSLAWDDPEIAIDWPINPGMEPILSSKDELAPSFRDCLSELSL